MKQSMMALLAASFLFTACNNGGADETDKKDSSSTEMQHSGEATLPLAQHAMATLSGTYSDTAVTGVVKFDADSTTGKVVMLLELTIPAKANQSVAVHLHEHGDCGDNGKNSHGHWNPTQQAHGKWGSAQFHLGDIGNVTLDAQGKGSLSMETNLWTLGGPAASNILGRAVIVHGGMDDYTTQPTGNAGNRIGCGVIQ